MKVYKKVMKAFGGGSIYVDKKMLNALQIIPGDEIVIDIQPDKLIITKPLLDANKIKEILDANATIKRRI